MSNKHVFVAAVLCLVMLLPLSCRTRRAGGPIESGEGPTGPTPPVEPAPHLSLAHAVWTNYVARTNGRSMKLWAKYTHPAGWPSSAAPIMAWNPTSLVTAYSNYTGISQCWEAEGDREPVAFTLLTRRHAYTRGHRTGVEADGKAHWNRSYTGMKVWFVTPDNQVVEARIAKWLTRLGHPTTNRTEESYCDYSLVIFSNDLPRAIRPLKAMRPADYKKFYLADTRWPHVLFRTEQGGHVSSGVPPFVWNTWKGSDFGSPEMLPIGDWLVFIGGLSTTGPTDQMQEDIDRLTRSMGLETDRYQLGWVEWEKEKPELAAKATRLGQKTDPGE